MHWIKRRKKQETENEKENKKEKVKRKEKEKEFIFADNQSAKFLFQSFKRRRRLVSPRC